MVQVVECLPTKRKDLSLNSSITIKGKKKKNNFAVLSFFLSFLEKMDVNINMMFEIKE
jgi:hypothetical protein